MKLPPILTGIVLDPAAGTLDFSALGVGFDPRTVLAVLHEPTNRFLFAKGRSGLTYAAIAGPVMTLTVDTTGLATGPLTGFLDDGALIATDARLEACRALLATANATLSNLATGLGTPSDVATGSDAAAGSLIAKVTRLLGTQSGIAAVLAAIRDRLPAALVGGRLSVDGSGVVQPVAVGNFPATQPVSGTVSLGAGAAQIGTIGNAFALDATAQAGNTSLSSIDGKLTGAAKDGADPASPAVANAGTGIRGWLATIAGQLGGTLKTTLQAGTAIVGRFGIDQTTPGTTNGVVVNSGALSADLRVAGAAVTGANAVPTYLPGIANAAGTAAGTALSVQGTAAGVPIPTTVRGAGTNRSTTVGTTATPLMAANTSRQGWKIKNDSAGDIWINFDATATAAPGGGNIKVPAGSYLSSEPGFVETGAMSAIGSAAGLAITAREH